MTKHAASLAPPLADPEIGVLDDLINTDRYPLHQPGTSAWHKVVENSKEDLAAAGCATLDGFLNPVACQMMADEIQSLARRVPIRRQLGSVYHRTALEQDLPEDDPRCAPMEWHAGHVTRDMLPPFSPAQRLYVSPRFKAFVAAVVGQATVFEYADPLAALVATVLPPGGRYPWHYDTNEYVVTIMLQQPEVGGVFEYHRNLRSPGDENLAGLGDVLVGRPETPARRTTAKPGDLQLFLGRYSLHQVTEVAGLNSRLVLVLSYAEHPGVIGPVDRTRSVYGRVTEAHLLAEQARLADNDGLIL